jgi:trehalose 6-phosphate synthase
MSGSSGTSAPINATDSRNPRLISASPSRDKRREADLEVRWSALSLQKLLQERLRDCEVIVVPIANLTFTTSPNIQLSSFRSQPAAWLRHLSRSCVLAVESALPTAAARRTAIPLTHTIASICLQVILSTLCGGSGSAVRKSRDIIYGFANEGLWPVCHVAFMRPPSDGPIGAPT